MGIAAAAAAPALAASAEVLDGAVLPDQAVIERLSVTAGPAELDMVPDFLGDSCGVFAQLTADAFKGFLFQQASLNDDSFGLS